MSNPIKFDRHFSVRLPVELANEIGRRARAKSQRPSEYLRQCLLTALAAGERR